MFNPIKVRTAAITLGTLLASLAISTTADAGTYYACVKKKGGAIRIVSRTTRCKRGERKISFNSQGVPGKNGVNGASGTNGTNGTNGANGTTGFTSTLPKGQTEMGTWGAFAAGKEAYSPISFGIPLATAPAVIVTEAGPEPPKPPCSGTVAKPAAESGHLCIYLNTGNLEGSVGVFDPATGGEGAEVFGTLVRITDGPGKADGSWAVTG